MLIKCSEKLIYVATDDKNIFDHCIKQDIQCLMTSENCLTGTDRLGEVADLIDADYYINIQGDEPLFNPNDINKLIKVINGKKPLYDVYCGYCKIKRSEEFYSSHMPKVVFNSKKSFFTSQEQVFRQIKRMILKLDLDKFVDMLSPKELK